MRGENVTDDRDAQIEDKIDEVDERFFYDDIVDHKQTRAGNYRFKVIWNTGEITWEPENYLREDAPDDFARYLRKSALSELDQYAWAQDLGSNDKQEDLWDLNGSRSDDKMHKMHNDERIIEFKNDDAETPLEEEEHQQPIQSRTNRHNLRSRPEQVFSACIKHEDAFDTEPDPTHAAFATVATKDTTEAHPVSMCLPEPQSLRAVLQCPPEIRMT